MDPGVTNTTTIALVKVKVGWVPQMILTIIFPNDTLPWADISWHRWQYVHSIENEGVPSAGCNPPLFLVAIAPGITLAHVEDIFLPTGGVEKIKLRHKGLMSAQKCI